MSKRVGVLWTLVATGCSDAGFSYAKAQEVCASEYWADEAVEDLIESDLWTMEERWHSLDGLWTVGLVAVPLYDTDGNGFIGDGDRLDLVATFASEDDLAVLDGRTGEPLTVLNDLDWAEVHIADIDPAPGWEIVALSGDRNLTVSLVAPDGTARSAMLPGPPATWGGLLTDLDNDGQAEVVGRKELFDLTTGGSLFTIPTTSGPPTAADLDGDGQAELMVHKQGDGHVAIYGADGTLIGTCSAPAQESGRVDDVWMTAVGELDGDPALEILIGGSNGLAVCDIDGTVIASAISTVRGTLAIAELDGDPLPEILAQNGTAILAYENDLTPMPNTALRATGDAFSVADLDGDGVHEILTWSPTHVSIIRATGTPLAYFALPQTKEMSTWSARLGPVVADVDGDGLAEIVVGEWARGGVTVLENARGGWDVPGSDRAWTGLGHHPSARTATGQIALLGPGDLGGGRNVWNGRPAVPAACSRAIGIEVRDVCTDGCAGDASVTAYVSNRGVLPVSEGLTLALLVDGVVAAESRVPSIEPERAVPVQLTVAAKDLDDGFEVRLAGSEAVTCAVPTATWSEPVCAD